MQGRGCSGPQALPVPTPSFRFTFVLMLPRYLKMPVLVGGWSSWLL